MSRADGTVSRVGQSARDGSTVYIVDEFPVHLVLERTVADRAGFISHGDGLLRLSVGERSGLYGLAHEGDTLGSDHYDLIRIEDE